MCFACYDVALQAMKTRIERLSFCVGLNSVVRHEGDGDRGGGGIAGSDGGEETYA